MTNNWLTYKDIEESINEVSTIVDKTKLIVYPIKELNDVDAVVGKIIQTSQHSEMQVKAFMGMLKIDRKSLSIKGIGDLIAHLCNKNIFNEDEVRILRTSVKVRNYIIHHFYVELENQKNYDLQKIEITLNSILWIINEGIKIVQNKINSITNNGAK